MENRNKLFLFGTVAVVAIIVGGMFLTNIRGPRPAQPTDDTQPVTTSDNVENTLVVNDQDAGDTIFVESASISKGFVVAHEIDESGEPGAVIGISELIFGTSTNIRVPLAKFTLNGDRVIVMLHEDGNSDSEFILEEDPVAKDADGNNVTRTIRTGSAFDPTDSDVQGESTETPVVPGI